MNKRVYALIFVTAFLGAIIVGCSNPCKQADKLIIKGEYDKAIEILNKYVKENDQDFTAYMLLGDAYVGKARKISPVYDPATVDMVNKGLDYYKKSYEIKRTNLCEQKRAMASQLLEQ